MWVSVRWQQAFVFTCAALAVAQVDDDVVPIGDDDDIVVNCNPDIATIEPGVSFGPGTTGYEDGTRLCWLIETGGTDATVVFDFFHTEYRRDIVRIFDASKGKDTPEEGYDQPLSGELPTPFVLRMQTSRMLVQFLADDSFHSSDAVTLQLGFSAKVFDSSDGSCANDCSGHGECQGGYCDCEPEWGPDGYTDCSVATKPLKPLDPQVVQLGIGEWSYFRIDLDETKTVLIELVDWGSPDSDPRLMLDTDSVPTLSYYTYNDWFNWYYDCSDIHYLRGWAQPGTIFVGVTNDRQRATEQLRANLTLRTEDVGEVPCLLDCNGHGTCDKTTGDCLCDDGWEGSLVNAPDTCQYELRTLLLGKTMNSSVRIGDWDYYSIEITQEDIDAGSDTLFVSFNSNSPHSYPIIFARYGEVPRLWEGYLPTYGAFDFDVGDQDGFELVQGQRMSLIVNSSVLVAGTWYVGVYNIWGQNGAEQYNSHDTCSYTLWAEIYYSGVPCPRTSNGFCDGIQGACDFNTGSCNCPPNKIWRDCYYVAETLVKNGDTLENRQLAVNEAEYFLVSVSAKELRTEYNLVIEVVAGSGDATPMVLARFGELPFPNVLSQYDDHDLLSTFYHDRIHQILLDSEELSQNGAGYWYIAVFNPESSTSVLEFSIKAVWTATVDCPTDHAGVLGTCSGAGVCVDNLGRCDCDDGNVMDDCSADGVFRLSAPEDSASSAVDSDRTPPIAPDDWVYWSVVVGCEDRLLEVDFVTTDDASLPFLVVRRGKLPLMATGTYDYWDYYTGDSHHAVQRIAITSCEDDALGCAPYGCCVTPLYPGTAFATGSPEPGVYYIGVYNDQSASEAIENYAISISLNGAPPNQAEDCDVCASGFLSPPYCDRPCPGLAPSDVYSNSPTGAKAVCSDKGECVDSSPDPVCVCEASYVGERCNLQCPSSQQVDNNDDIDDADETTVVCGGHGTCELDDEGHASCACDEGYGGLNCVDSCPNEGCGSHGSCVYTSEPDAYGDSTAHCVCDDGYVGDQCEFQCPGNGNICSNVGTCVVVHSYLGKPMRASCDCPAGHHGSDCSLQCPYGKVPGTSGSVLECSGEGACTVSVEETSAACACNQGYTGSDCSETLSDSTSSGGSKSKSSGLSAAAAAGIAIAAGTVLALAIAAAFLAERRKREITRYERLVREVGAASSTIITAAGTNSAYDAPGMPGSIGDTPIPDYKQMRNLSDSVSPFHTEKVEL